MGILVRGDLAYVADDESGKVHAFALATGHHIATPLGEKDKGPGEFRGLDWTGDCGGDRHLRV